MDPLNAQAMEAPTAVDKALGRAVRYHRVKRNLSRHEMADSLGIDVDALQVVESGGERITAAWLINIAIVLQIPAVCLLQDATDLVAGFLPWLSLVG